VTDSLVIPFKSAKSINNTLGAAAGGVISILPYKNGFIFPKASEEES
jgi:hypothetical protein